MVFWEKWLKIMPKQAVVLGLDTSCYTTSLALMSLDGELLADQRCLLTVKPGGRGLAQSEMVFQHTRNLPTLVAAVGDFAPYELKAVGVSSKPRPLPDSYMPAFLTGLGLGQNIGRLLQVPVYTLSHQENHLCAGLWSAQGPNTGAFLLLHASGGTTDFLRVTTSASDTYDLQQVGTGIDLHAGQFVDRVGVALGLQFPTGPYLEQLADTAEQAYNLPVAVQAGNISFSGPCSAALRALAAGAAPAELALGVEAAIGQAFSRALVYHCRHQQLSEVLMVGGVGANRLIRTQIEDKLSQEGIELFVPKAQYSGDGAVGAAYYARQQVIAHGHG